MLDFKQSMLMIKNCFTILTQIKITTNATFVSDTSKRLNSTKITLNIFMNWLFLTLFHTNNLFFCIPWLFFRFVQFFLFNKILLFIICNLNKRNWFLLFIIFIKRIRINRTTFTDKKFILFFYKFLTILNKTYLLFSFILPNLHYLYYNFTHLSCQ